MKNILLAVVAVITTLAIPACHKSSGSLHGFMSATINGQHFSSSHCTIGSYFSAATGDSGSCFVGWSGGARTFDPPDISISIANYVFGATGTYTITNTYDSANSVFASIDSTATSGRLLDSGRITINSSSKTVVSGTFFLASRNGTMIIDGVFTAVGH